MKHHRILSLLLVLLCLSHNVCALFANENPAQYNYQYININKGLCDNSIRAIHKDKNSFMWIGTANGLDRYDGYEFKHYSTAATNPYNFIGSNYINDIQEDEKQNLWIASDAGVTRLDMASEEVCYLKDYQGNNKEIINTPVQTIQLDDYGNLWIGKHDCLAYAIIDEYSNITDIRVIKTDIDVKTIANHNNEIWVGGKQCLLRYRGNKVNKIVSIPIEIQIKNGELTFKSLYSFGNYLWIGSSDGLYCFNSVNKSYTHYKHNPNQEHSISSNYITAICGNNSGNIVVGTRSGVNIYMWNDKFSVYQKEKNSNALSDNIINKVFVDDDNNIWVGTNFGGINLMIPKSLQFSYHLQGTEKRTPNIISTVIEDQEGNLLVGIVDGGLAIKKSDRTHFTHLTHDKNKKNSLSHNNISKIVQDLNGNYWISTIGGGLNKLNKNDLSNPIFQHYNVTNSSLPSNEIYDIAFDSIRNSLWICSSNQIHIMDLNTNTINRLHYFMRSNNKINNINTLFIDSQSRLWIGGSGVYIIDLNNAKDGYECVHFPYKLDNPESRINEKILCIFETKSKDIYLGSLGYGIYLLDKNSSSNEYKFKNYTNRSGFTDNSILNIIEDDNANLWVSTLKGIYYFDTSIERAFKFDENDGLLVQQFYKRSGCKTKNSDIILGSVDGLVTFTPITPITDIKDRAVVITSFICDGKEFIPHLNSDKLSLSESNAKEVHLYPPQNSFELTFCCQDYVNQDKIFYFHRILEFDERINVGLKKRHAKYTNLPSGRYTLEMWCTNYNNTWSSARTYLTIVVHPPFYNTTWFYTLISLLVLLLLSYTIYSYSKRQKQIQLLLKEKINERTSALNETIIELTNSKATIIEQNQQLMTQNQEISKQKNELYDMSQQMERVNKEKLSFFTNMAHEFKTPLTLIQGPTTILLKRVQDREQQENLLIVNRNAQYLLSLVNKLIDLRKIDSSKYTLTYVHFNLTTFLNDTINDFSSLMKERQISCKIHYRLKRNNVYSDKECLQKIVFNLLSNAVKYTPNKGSITLYVNQFNDITSGQLMLYISVANSGSVINEDEMGRIFDCFYRIPRQNKYMNSTSSTGIGLYIVKEIVNLLQGCIKIKSSEKLGVIFRIYFPITVTNDNIEEIILEKDSSVQKEDIIEPFIEMDRDKPTLLLVEDNADMRFYIKNMLKGSFNVAEANNGEVGYKLAQRIIPDFIVSDLMMPINDGNEFCKMVRDNEALSHIPFLLLTANSSENAKVESYNMGADGYLTKPFEEAVLLANINAILKNRARRQKNFLKEDLNISKLEIGHFDQYFMNQIMDALENNYSDSDFGVKELSNMMNISYAVIYKKLVSLTGLSPTRFILLYRLQLAKKILENNTKNYVTVSEIAYSVGFNDPKYFTRCFMKQYNFTPSSLIK